MGRQTDCVKTQIEMVPQMKAHLALINNDIKFFEKTIKQAKENIENQDWNVDWKTVLSDSEKMVAICKKIRDKLTLDIKIFNIK